MFGGGHRERNTRVVHPNGEKKRDRNYEGIDSEGASGDKSTPVPSEKRFSYRHRH